MVAVPTATTTTGSITMRIESSALTVSWIPSASVPPLVRAPFELGVMRYDDPPAEHIDDLGALTEQGGFRFLNELTAWIEVDDDGRIVDHGQGGGCHMGATTFALGRRAVVFPAVGYPDVRLEPEVGEEHVRFVQTAGGRIGVPVVRPTRTAPFVSIEAPPVWTTLALTLHADGRVEREFVGASAFPRHWVYDDLGQLVTKSGVLDFGDWVVEVRERGTPWGLGDRPPVVAEAVSRLEHALSAGIMRSGTQPERRTVAAGDTLVVQGEPGDALFLVLDGLMDVEVDGEPVAEVGPGAVIGERAILEDGRRTATLRATTKVRVAAVPADHIDQQRLADLRASHRREEPGE
jgi:hypothetical protein